MNDLLTTIILLSILIVQAFTIAILVILYVKNKKSINSIKSCFYILLDRIESCRNKIYEENTSIEAVDDDLNLLSSGIRSFVQGIQQAKNEKVYPSPKLAEMIEWTIKEHTEIFIALSVGQNAPSRDGLEFIAKEVAKTYPNVDEEYISRKVTAYIEHISKQR